MMKVTIELFTGPNHSKDITEEDIQKNIDAVDRAINNKKAACDDILLLDTKTILIGIQQKLQEREE